MSEEQAVRFSFIRHNMVNGVIQTQKLHFFIEANSQHAFRNEA